ncbi:MAG: hypothetical protein HY861_03585 [Chlamydiia bacterium]|nr:hypothetical protein [Chlamydiia bacterium]
MASASRILISSSSSSDNSQAAARVAALEQFENEARECNRDDLRMGLRSRIQKMWNLVRTFQISLEERQERLPLRIINPHLHQFAQAPAEPQSTERRTASVADSVLPSDPSRLPEKNSVPQPFLFDPAYSETRIKKVIGDMAGLLAKIPEFDRMPGNIDTLDALDQWIRKVMRQKHQQGQIIRSIDWSGMGLTFFFDPLPLFLNPIFERVETLNLSGNSLQHLPDTLKIPELLHLDISRNSFTEPLALERFPKLRTLKASHTMFWMQDNQVPWPPMLEIIDLSSNRLSTLPDRFSQLQCLRELSLQNNTFQQVPHSICSLPLLEKLDFSDNLLTSLPEDIEKLKELHSLDLHSNLLKNLPRGMARLPKLRSLQISRNPIPLEVASYFLHDRASEVRIDDLNALVPLRMSLPADPKAALGQQLKQWASHLERFYPRKDYSQFWQERNANFTGFLDLSDREQSVLAEFLALMETTADSRKESSLKMIAERIENMLQLSLKNKLFRRGFLSTAEEAITTCADRVQLFFCDMQALYLLYADSSNKEQAAIAAAKYDAVKELASEYAAQKNPREAVQTLLQFIIALQQFFTEAIWVKDMYFTAALDAGLPEDSNQREAIFSNTLKELESWSVQELFARSELWRTVQKEEHPELVKPEEASWAVLRDVANDCDEYYGSNVSMTALPAHLTQFFTRYPELREKNDQNYRLAFAKLLSEIKTAKRDFWLGHVPKPVVHNKNS